MIIEITRFIEVIVESFISPVLSYMKGEAVKPSNSKTAIEINIKFKVIKPNSLGDR